MNKLRFWQLFAVGLLWVGSWVVQAAWQPTNPGGGGAMNSPVITDEGYWAVGTDLGGLYVSKNQGKTWKAIGAIQGLKATHVAAVVAHPNKLLVGAEGGLFVGKTDGSAMSRRYTGGYVSALAVAANPNIIYAAVEPAWDQRNASIIRSDDAGVTWRKVSTNLPTNLFVVGLRPHPVDPDGIWVLSGDGRGVASPAQAWLSIDGGATWTQRDPKQGDVVDVAYAQDANNLNRLYLTTERNGVGSFYMSPDTGYSWQRLNPNVPSSGVTGVILADSSAPKHVRLIDFNERNYSANTYLWETTDGGKTWTSTANKVTGGWSPSDENWGMGYSYQGLAQTIGYRPDRPNTILWTNNQFTYKSLNGGKTWYDTTTAPYAGGKWASRGLDNAVPAIVEPSAVNSNLVYAGYLDMGLWRSDNGGATWKSLNTLKYSHTWLGGGGNTLSIIADPARENVVWAQVAGDLNDGDPTTYTPIHLLKSTNKGESWTELTNGLPSKARRIEGLAIANDSAVNYRWLFVVVDGDVYLSKNDGAAWSKVLDCNTCFKIAYTNAGVFALSSEGVWRSWQGGVSNSWNKMALPSSITSGWTTAEHWLYNAWTYSGVVDMAAKGKDELWLAVKGSNKGLYYSKDSGTSWMKVYNNAYVRAVTIDPSNGQILLGSSSTGLNANTYNAASQGVLVHSTGRTATGWKKLNTGLAFPFATNISVSAAGQRWLNSPGQGILRWR